MKPIKSIMSRYAIKNVNTKYFGSIDVANSGGTNEGGIVFMPYVMANTGTIISDGWSFDETTEQKAERIREEETKN